MFSNSSNSSKPNEEGPVILKILDDKRRELALTMLIAYKNLDNASCYNLLGKKLDAYYKVKNETQHVLKESLERKCKNSNVFSNTLKFESNIDKVDQNILKPLSCSDDRNGYCPISENFRSGEFNEFNNMYQSINNEKSSTYGGLSNKSSKNTIDYQSTNLIQFKTAKEELQVQNMKKINNKTSGSLSLSTGQKRKLGSQRSINSKFVSPLLSSSENSKDMENMGVTPEVDKRLKHIDANMIELVKSEIMDCGSNLSWDDIAGLTFAKDAIKEAVVWPILRPDLFKGLRTPPKAVLLFGPPGTGKTLIGKCIASQCKSTFFSISASSLTSKWVGDGEKMVRALFAVARVHQPAVIFIDEIDSLLSQRTDTEHESSRRIKTEFLVQIDGATTYLDEKLLIIGATNRPQELDEAARRRFVKRLYIPLPNAIARLGLLKNLLSNENHNLTQLDLSDIAIQCEGFSGADMKQLCSEASLEPIRKLDVLLIEQIASQDVRPLQKEDFYSALSRVKSSVSVKDLEALDNWDKLYGSGF